MNENRFLVFLVVFGLLLSACAASRMGAAPERPAADQGFYSTDYDASYNDDINESFAESGGEIGRSSTGANVNIATEASLTERIVIRNADLTIVVSDPAESSRQIAAMAEEMGGFVVNLNVYQTTFESGIEGERASITIRVPVERLDEAVETIKEGTLEVRNEMVSGQDVTEEYTDMQSRLRHLEAVELQLLDFLEAADNTEDTLDVFAQLQQIQSDIEIIKGRIQYLEDSARLSRISIELQPDFADRPLQIGSWRPVGTAKDAIEALISTLQFIGNVIIVLFLYVLPVAIVIAILLWPLRKLYRRFRPKKEKNPAEEE